MFDFRLKVFYTVAKNLSFSRTAEELYITQPAVTKHIKAFERFLSIRLFDRSGNKIKLTPAGKIVYEKAKQIFEIYAEIEHEIGELRMNYTGLLRLAASTTIAQWVIPEVLHRFQQAYPHIKITLFSGNSRRIEEGLINNEFDLGIVEGNKIRKELKYKHFMDDTLYAVVPVDSSYAGKSEITWDELKKIPIVLREIGSGTLDVIAKELKEKAEISINELNVLMHLGSSESIKTFLYHADAMAIISCYAVNKEIKAGILKPIKIKEMKFNREFRFTCPQGTNKGLVEKFMSFAKREYPSKL